MTLSKDLRIENVVILANNFNPSIFASHWLIDRKICAATDILQTSVFASNISQLDTVDFQLLVLLNQMQFTKSTAFSGNFSESIKTKLIQVINKLPEVPYLSAGINFHWFIKDGDLTIPQLSRKSFFNKESKLHSYFDSDDMRVGTYLSKDIGAVRLKLDIKPSLAIFNQDNKQDEYIQWIFNYHVDLNGDQKKLLSFIEDHPKYFKISEEIIKNYA